MAGPIAIFVSGHRCRTACAITWAVEWRRTASASGSRSVRMRSCSPSCTGKRRSRTSPSTWTATAALARRGPTAAAASRPLAPSGRSRPLPSGRVTFIVGSIQTRAGTLAPMTAAIAALAVALGIAVVLLVRGRRGQAQRDEALARDLRDRVPRSEVSEARAGRDALMAAVPSPVLVFDADGRLVRANALARDEATALLDLDSQPDLAAAVEAALAGGTAAGEIGLTVYEPDRRRYRAHLQAFRGEGGARCVVVLTDESAEADYRDARRLFSAGVSHELRTPLQRILGLVETLGLDLPDAARSDTIAQARLEVDGMRRLIEDMIMLVQLESHGFEASGEATERAEAVEGCVRRHAEAAAEAGMPLEAQANRGLAVAVSPRLVDAVLDNLVENAIRHAGSGA